MKIRSEYAWCVVRWYRKGSPVQVGHKEDEILVPILNEAAVACTKRGRKYRKYSMVRHGSAVAAWRRQGGHGSGHLRDGGRKSVGSWGGTRPVSRSRGVEAPAVAGRFASRLRYECRALSSRD